MEVNFVCIFKLATDVVRGRVRMFLYDMDRLAILKNYLMGLCMDGHWQIWVRGCGSETVSIYVIRESESERLIMVVRKLVIWFSVLGFEVIFRRNEVSSLRIC